MITYLYALTPHPDPDSSSYQALYIVEKAFWEENHCLDDDFDEELVDSLEENGFYVLAESAFEFEGTMREARKALAQMKNAYFIEDNNLREFCDRQEN